MKSAVRTKVIKARHALLEEGGATGDAELHAAIRALDRAAEKGVLHRNNARRRKSRLASMAARLDERRRGSRGRGGSLRRGRRRQGQEREAAGARGGEVHGQARRQSASREGNGCKGPDGCTGHDACEARRKDTQEHLTAAAGAR